MPHKSSFFPRTARLWNDLPPDLSSCSDLKSFRAGIVDHLNLPTIKYSSHYHLIINHPNYPYLIIHHHPIHTLSYRFHSLNSDLSIKIINSQYMSIFQSPKFKMPTQNQIWCFSFFPLFHLFFFMPFPRTPCNTLSWRCLEYLADSDSEKKHKQMR